MARIAILLIAVTLTGCSDSTGPDDMRDGRYDIAITNEPISAGDIPGWAAGTATITVEKDGDDFTVVASDRSEVAIGPVELVQVLEGRWNLHMPLDTEAFPGASADYFFAQVNAGSCTEAGARDGNRLETYFAIDCSVSPR